MLKVPDQIDVDRDKTTTLGSMGKTRLPWRLFAILLACCLEFVLGFTRSSRVTFFRRKRRGQRHAAHGENDWDEFLDRFSGDFDNYNQVVEDRKRGMMPREGGGHEHIHCLLIPLSRTTRLAAFYVDGVPERIFRFRYYSIESAEMKLYTLHPALEQELRATMDPTEWPHVFQEHADRTLDGPLIQELQNCNVRWSREMDPVQHAYAKEQFPNKMGHHAVMVHGEAIVDSTMVPGSKILIRDQLSLWQDEFWIHDRGFDPDTGDYIYGNQRGVPYQLQRVTRINDAGLREVVNADLQWTMGPQWRTPEDYDKRIAALGGASSKLNSKES